MKRIMFLSAIISLFFYYILSTVVYGASSWNPRDFSKAEAQCAHKNTDPRANIMRILIFFGADTDKQNAYGDTLLHLIALAGYYDIARALVFGGARITIRNSAGQTPLFYAVKAGQIKIMYLLCTFMNHTKLQKHTEVYDLNKQSPLHWAVYYQQYEAMKLLLKTISKDCINARDKKGQTALHIAAIKSQGKFFEELLVCGAHLYLKDNYGRTPVDYALDNKDPYIIGVLFHWAVVSNNLALINTLVSCASLGDIDAKNEEGRTPLHIAAIASNKPILEALLSGRPNVNVYDDLCRLPLDYALDNYKSVVDKKTEPAMRALSIVDSLVEAGAEVKQPGLRDNDIILENLARRFEQTLKIEYLASVE